MSAKCERCGTEFERNSAHIVPCHWYGHWVNIGVRCLVCHKCWCEWRCGDYYEIWYTFYHADNFELADKFALDFLGKLGE